MSRAGLHQVASQEFQLAIWGYALAGDGTEKTAIICEQRDNAAVFIPNAWDYTARRLDSMSVSYGNEPPHRPPDYWCLPAVTELRLLRDAAFWEVANRAR